MLENDQFYPTSTVYYVWRFQLIEIWQKISIEMESVIKDFPESDYQKLVDFVYPNGNSGQMFFWYSFLHFTNHTTYHRGQLVTVLRQAGFPNLSNTDLGAFFMEN